jgi:hypothetical protein
MLPRSHSRLGRQARTASDPRQRVQGGAAVIETQDEHAPKPIGDRLRANAARLRELADKHERTRITITATETR